MKQLRLWLAVVVIGLLAAVLVSQLRAGSDRALDPASSGHSGSKALASVLRSYGVRVRSTTELGSVRGRVVVIDPDAYSTDQLRSLAGRADLVLMAPSDRVLQSLDLPVRLVSALSGPTEPQCAWPGAGATSTVDLPDATFAYRGGQTCYDGAVARGDGWVVLGSQSLLRNDVVSKTGVAALDVNTITEDRTVTDVTWLLTGTAARSSAAPTAWALFPDGARRAFIWLGVVGLLLVAWRARRFGPVVSEPLPVLVRSAEVVEGHGRLYHRAAARDRAAAALRAGSAERLSRHLGLHRGSIRADVVEAAALRTGFDPMTVGSLLGGPPPPDDARLIELAVALDDLEAAAGVAGIPPHDPRTNGALT